VKILIQTENFDRIPDKSEKAYWNPMYRPDISGVQNWIVQFVKLKHPVLTGQRIKNFRENLRS
jgi:hypothetical protein